MKKCFLFMQAEILFIGLRRTWENNIHLLSLPLIWEPSHTVLSLCFVSRQSFCWWLLFFKGLRYVNWIFSRWEAKVKSHCLRFKMSLCIIKMFFWDLNISTLPNSYVKDVLTNCYALNFSRSYPCDKMTARWLRCWI